MADELAAFEARTPAERLAFFTAAFARCTRCGACQAACPLCACARCVAEKTRPQWIPSAPHPGGTFTFHVVRALHLAGRCAGCLECERACPAGIPLGLVAAELGAIARRRFGHEVDANPAAAPLIGVHRPDDPEEFIR
jgi:Fe-S oxidoreductase